MKLHKEGNISIILGFIVLSAISLISFYFLLDYLWIPISVSLLSLIVFSLILWFFRFPKREFKPDNNTIVCPADGKIVVIEKTFEPEFLKTECIQISVFMSPLNVHINWYPIPGLVKESVYHPGKYLVAWHPKSSTENERSSVLIESVSGKEIVVRQIAGAVARRIVTYAKKGDKAMQNKQLGFIKFGSRVDLFLPLNSEILIKPGEKVKGNKTIIAKIV